MACSGKKGPPPRSRPRLCAGRPSRLRARIRHPSQRPGGRARALVRVILDSGRAVTRKAIWSHRNWSNVQARAGQIVPLVKMELVKYVLVKSHLVKLCRWSKLVKCVLVKSERVKLCRWSKWNWSNVC